MIEVTYKTYSKILNKSFVNKKEVESIEDFNLFALSLNLNFEIIEVKVCNPIFVGKDQLWQNETTNYWFEYDGTKFAVSDCNGGFTILDIDGAPITNEYSSDNKKLIDILLPLVEEHILD